MSLSYFHIVFIGGVPKRRTASCVVDIDVDDALDNLNIEHQRVMCAKAIAASRERGCNPGGAAEGAVMRLVTKDPLPEHFLNRLLSFHEDEQLIDLLVARGARS